LQAETPELHEDAPVRSRAVVLALAMQGPIPDRRHDTGLRLTPSCAADDELWAATSEGLWVCRGNRRSAQRVPPAGADSPAGGPSLDKGRLVTGAASPDH
jgi:hypothetical protein